MSAGVLWRQGAGVERADHGGMGDGLGHSRRVISSVSSWAAMSLSGFRAEKRVARRKTRGSVEHAALALAVGFAYSAAEALRAALY